MRKIFKLLLWVVCAVAILFFLSVIFSSKKIRTENSVNIDASLHEVWPYINSMKTINSWIPWVNNNPGFLEVYGGNSGEVGDTFIWENKNTDFRMKETITEIIPFQKTIISGVQNDETLFTVTFLIVSEGNGSKVTWKYDGEVKPLQKPLKFIGKRHMNEQVQSALENLKRIVEEK